VLGRSGRQPVSGEGTTGEEGKCNHSAGDKPEAVVLVDHRATMPALFDGHRGDGDHELEQRRQGDVYAPEPAPGSAIAVHRTGRFGARLLDTHGPASVSREPALTAARSDKGMRQRYPTRQTGLMERDYAVGIIQREAERVLQLANIEGADLTAPVPSCPDWDFLTLVRHLGNVYNWAGTIVEERLPAPPGPEMPRQPEAMSPVDWLSDRLDRILAVLRHVPEDTEMWNFSAASPGPPAFWWRRQVHETVIHRADAELACALPVTALEPELAADNVSELFEIMRFSELGLAAGATASPASAPATSTDAQPALVIHLHATDLPGAEWTVDTVARTVRREHTKGDVAIRGPAWSLARWCWGRPVGAEIEAFGDLETAEQWRGTIAP
jgi:uncharacterized protein (TIGR03083 family)